MVGKSGTARLARRAGVAITPVGLWGTHRILTKGRKPHWQWGVRADRGRRRADRVAARRAREARDRADDGRDHRVRRAGARDLSRSAPEPGDDPWWWRDPETADAHRRTRMTRVAVIGAGSWGTAVAAIVAGNAPTMLWARRAELADAHRRPTTRTPTTCRDIPLPDAAARDRRPRRGVRRRRRRRVRGAVARAARGARRGAAARRRRVPRSSAWPRASSRARCARMTEVIARGARRSRPDAHRRAHRAEPRPRGRGRSADRVGRRRARRRGRRRAAAGVLRADVPRVHEPRRRRLRDGGRAEERARDRRRHRRRARLRRQHQGRADHARLGRARAARRARWAASR